LTDSRCHKVPRDVRFSGLLVATGSMLW